MTPKPTSAEDIRKAGWEPEWDLIGPTTKTGAALYRATQGPFSTPWMRDWSEVLSYIQGKAKGEK